MQRYSTLGFAVVGGFNSGFSKELKVGRRFSRLDTDLALNLKY
jgi:hypothetical protein